MIEETNQWAVMNDLKPPTFILMTNLHHSPIRSFESGKTLGSNSLNGNSKRAASLLGYNLHNLIVRIISRIVPYFPRRSPETKKSLRFVGVHFSYLSH